MADLPEVTVVVPTRDRWPLLSTHAVPAALSQEDVELELVVVDDGSSDGTSSKLAGVQDPRLRVVRHTRPSGVAGARNAGVAVARAPWIAFLDDDDLWSPRKLRAQLDLALHADADVVYAAGVLVDERLSVLAHDVFPPTSELPRLLLDGNVLPGGCSNVLARTDLVRQVGCFDERLTYTEDWDLWVRLALAGKIAACPDVLVAHVQHRGGALFRYRPDVLSEVEYVLAKHNPDLEPSRARALRLGALEWMAHEYRRAGYRQAAARAYLQLARERRRAADLGRALVALTGKRGASVARTIRRVLSRGDGAPHVPPDVPWLDRYRDRSAHTPSR